MKLQDFGVSPGKVDDLRRRIERLGIDLAQVEESFIRGGGKGGQKINKTSNCVQLRYAPLDLVVRCQEDRRRAVNRFLALRRLVDEIEFRVSPETSEKGRRIAKLRAAKARARRRSVSESANPPPPATLDGGEEP